MHRLRTLAIAIPFILASLLAVAANDEHARHADTSDFVSLFKDDLSNAVKPEGVWTAENGVFTASEDEAIWSEKDYDNFILDLEFKMGEGANSGVAIYCSDIKDWIPNSIEIQIQDDRADKWKDGPKNWRCGGVFGHLAPSVQAGNAAGEWNRYTITCRDSKIDVVLNGEHVASMDMKEYTSAKKNPDGSDVPPWLSKPAAELPTKGRIGFQGKHAGAQIWFRNIKVKELK